MTDASAYVAEIFAFRAQKDEFFANSPDSPFASEGVYAPFAGLHYFQPDATYRVSAQFRPAANRELFRLSSTGSEPRPQIKAGELTFTLHGRHCLLTAFASLDEPNSRELFVPFRDETTGHETYSAGRYLEIERDADLPGEQTITLDFNLAYNPWCAYSASYICTLPPAENTLPVPVRAGELSPPPSH